MRGLEFRCKQPAHRNIRNRREPLCHGRRRHVAEGFTPRLRERRAAIGQNEPGCDAGMPNGHLQRHEPAIAVAEHDRILTIGGLLDRFGHPVSHRGQRPQHGVRPSEPRQFRNDHAKRR